MEPNPFKTIKGGKNNKPSLTSEERASALRKDILSQKELPGRYKLNQKEFTEKEKAELRERIKNELILNIKSSALKLSGKILTDEEANFINDRVLGLSNNNQATKKELQEKFPELIDFFDQILENLQELGQYLFDLSLKEMIHINRQREMLREATAVDNFEDFDFGKLDEKWRDIDSGNKKTEFSPEKNYTFYKKISWNERELFLSALKTTRSSEEKTLLENITFQIGSKRNIIRAKENGWVLDSQGGPNIEFVLTINYLEKPCPTIETHIIKNDSNKELPSGMTAPIYQKIFDYIQGQANKNKINYQHRIKIKTSISEQEPLSEEKWNKIFLPIIEKGGYLQSSPSSTTWIKEYKPE
ncbi:MAG: hypothetical protein A2271_02100 [Candidatus Moranbacteria bacterium RIFOXYA12_FULL_35_19]|nr:MAG: hypothetical protein UR78_C0022G0012 [Candidatus Moranbacteria bacterium GW2011_GWF2_35_39]OGI31794.1 MAG: hypothetical protein A2343_03465 [Candidatus Moranbacteria bacterium RIFOXYB12_FULL_35_8]OGI32095.1 MAG: hypothetical protein A2489_01660 [Candidatus Moranbacteria bacterium RIFOXYC12_FULL_36_13]OGI36755.1 MAG: hypothetical protein A2271_02100 [Candidatus Moranbacteria bacterium RIFOXYA12_FULL_35_19]